MKKIKAVVLILALALPVSIFLFLKYFGKNEFVVEPFFTDEMPEGRAHECGFAYAVPYQIPDSLLHQLGWNQQGALTLFSFDGGASHASAYNRIKANFEEQDVKIMNLVTKGEEMAPVRGIWTLALDKGLTDRFKRCFFFLDEPNDLLLVDTQGRIRGYYQLSSREEIDRLLMEISIILKRY
jgi:hypothetical protein